MVPTKGVVPLRMSRLFPSNTGKSPIIGVPFFGGAFCTRKLVRSLARRLVDHRYTMVTAESCTGGLLASLLTSVPGASRFFWGSYVCYTEDAKTSLLGVEKSLLETYGTVSQEVAEAMAQGALSRSRVTLAVAITGLAGPTGDGSATPIGTVWISCALREGVVRSKGYVFSGSRNTIRKRAVQKALFQTLDLLP